MLALTYAARAAGVVSVTAASTAQSAAALAADRRAAAAALGAADEATLLRADEASTLFGGGGGSSSSSGGGGGGSARTAPSVSAAAGSADAVADATAAALRAARLRYLSEYVCRTPSALSAPSASSGALPGCGAVALRQRSRVLYAALAGGRYFSPAGALGSWSAAPLAAALRDTPVLVTRGQHDEVSEASVAALAASFEAGTAAPALGGSGAWQHVDAWEQHLTAVERHICAAEGSPVPV
jgi:hypothetical protein